MTPIQPVGLWHYLSLKKNLLPQNLVHFHYLSWEDALWDLKKFFSYSDGSLVLVPDFFCLDVVENMISHGFQVVTYPVDRNFQTDPILFSSLLKEYQPDVAVIFHAVGITNALFQHKKKWLSSLPENTLLLEDSVHRVVNPEDISIVSQRHVVIDSMRKVIPLPGSNLFGSQAIATLRPSSTLETIPYQIIVLGWWLLFQFCLLIVTAVPSKQLQQWWNHLAEGAMLRGYDVIGDSLVAAPGNLLISWLSSHIDHERIALIKTQQVQIYKQKIKSIWSSSYIFPIAINERDFGKLRGYPIGLELTTATQILERLRAAGLLVRFELDTFGWSTKQKVIYLPLGPHLTQNQIEIVANTLITAIL